jgi:putative endonuclease
MISPAYLGCGLNSKDDKVAWGCTPNLGMDRQFYAYIMTNTHHTVLYTGVTNNLTRRVEEHRNPTRKCFTSRYNVIKLVYYEVFTTPMDAIRREKQIKAGPRWRKVRLIESVNSEWKDLAEGLGD